MRRMSKFAAKALALCLALTAVFSAAGCGEPEVIDKRISIFGRPTVERVAGQRKAWNDVDSFICYYGDFVDTMKKFDVVIMHSATLYSDPDAKAKVKELTDAGCYVIAYISVGEDETLKTGDGLGAGGYASYYVYENGSPKRNDSWGSYFVDAGNPVWQANILAESENILSYGVDGLFLDTLDTVDILAESLGGLADLIKKMDETFPDAKLVANRGFTTLPYISQHIDGVMFESFNTTWKFVGEDRVPTEASPESVEYNRKVACNVINRIRRYDYFPIFALEYVTEEDLGYMAQYYYDICWEFDFIPYVTSAVLLDEAVDLGIKPESKRGARALELFTEDVEASENNGDESPANLAYYGNGTKVKVSSTFPNYDKRVLNDAWYVTEENHVDDNWASECWASSDNAKTDHWIEFDFKKDEDVSKVIVYWALDAGLYRSPRECRIQAFVDGEWETVSTFTNEPEAGSTDYKTQLPIVEFTFDKVTTRKIRVLQPKNCGSADKFNDPIRTGIMWVSEVAIYA